jgi:hypothetical protein
MKRLRRSRRMAVLTVVILGVFGGAASAYFTATGAGTASARVGTLDPPKNVAATATRGSASVPITWEAPTTGISPQGYYLLRSTSGATSAPACETSPTALRTSTSCTDLGLPDGTYTFTVIAKYRSFSATATSNAVTVINDNTAPEVTLTSPADGSATASTAPTIRGAAGDATGDSNTVTVNIYDGTGTAGSVVQTLNITRSGASWSTSSKKLTPGTYTVQATQTDTAGNNATSTANTFIVDTSAPALTLTSPADGSATASTAPTISGAAGNAPGDSSTVTVTIYEGTGTGGRVDQTLSVMRSGASWSTSAKKLTQGTYTARAAQPDTAGNIATSTANTFVVDTTAPTVIVNQKAGQGDPTNVLAILWTVAFSEPVTGFDEGDLTRNGTSSGGTVAVSGSGASYTISLSGTPTNGTTRFSIAAAKAYDLAGNDNAASTSTDNGVAYDTVAPAVTLTSPSNESTALNSPTLSGAAGNAPGDSSTVTVKIYNGTGTGGSVNQTLTPTASATSWSTTAARLAQGTYTAQATQTDTAANTATSSANTFTVAGAPTLQMLDSDDDGKIDQVKATFDKQLAPSADTAPWTLTNAPSAGTLHSVSTSGKVATLALTPGGGAADTAVGSFKIALAASATGIRDAAGNQASFAATAPDDLAGPVLMTATSGGGTTNLMQSADVFALTFSEALASAPPNLVVTEQRSGKATLTIPGLINSAEIDKDYLPANKTSATSNTSPSVLSNLDKTVTVTLGTITEGIPATGTGGVPIVVPATSLKDTAGNAAAPTSRAMTTLF